MAYVLDPAGRIIDATDQWLAWMGRAVDEVIGCEPADFVSPELSEKVRAQVERFISSGEIDGEHRYATKDGCVMEAALSGGRFRREDGRPGTHYVVVTDMSERNSLIRQRNDSLERANEDEKNQRHHLAALNHELRTPVSSMVAAASLLKTGLDAERQVQMIDLIADAGHHLLELVNHSLTVFKGEADRVVLDNVRTNVIEMVGSVVKACSHAYGSPDVQSVFDFWTSRF
ncbi:MAG: PAS domain-containing sensor histidine kinase [Spirochaetia bacterium]|nr:PAS domain-containing sensor histidine kinase [Spirochaetia bacterium]